MPGLEDWVNKPLDIVQNIFESSSSEECHGKVSEYFGKRLNGDGFFKVPSLNCSPLHDLPSGSLVRFRCMIQDMFDPEYYLGAYEVVHVPSQRRYLRSGMYKDIADCQNMEEVNMESPRNITMDRLTYYCISVPGENEWASKGYAQAAAIPCQPTTSLTPSRQKRSLDGDADDADDSDMETDSRQPNDSAPKRSRTDDRPSANPSNNNNSNNNNNGATTSSQNLNGAGSSTTSTYPDLNFPLPNTTGVACLVKMYGLATQGCKVNDLLEVVGVLSVHPSLAHSHMCSCSDSGSLEGMSESEEASAEMVAHNPPPSLVPRLHAVTVRKLSHINPFLPWCLKDPDSSHVTSELLSRAPAIRSELVAVLTQALLGDSLAAEYLLCHLLSSVYVRKDVVALGKFSLNLMNVPLHMDYTHRIYTLLQKLVTKSYWLPLSLSNLNSLTFTPKKDYTKNRLTSGILQLSTHTHLVLDETALSVGRLDTKGVQNVTALGNLINWQRVEYDFSFHRMEYSTDVAILVLSEGKSLLSSDCHLPLRPSGAQGTPDRVFETIHNYMTESWLQQVRNYLTILKLVDYSMSQDLQKAVQEDFVDMRKQNKAVTADHLHSLLVFARFLSLSKGETSLSRESWEKAKSLETERKLRLDQAA